MANVRQSKESGVAETPVDVKLKYFHMWSFRCFHTSSVCIFTVRMDGADSTHIYVYIYKTTERNIMENLNLIQTHCPISGHNFSCITVGTNRTESPGGGGGGAARF